jgi:hypothetical protein
MRQWWQMLEQLMMQHLHSSSSLASSVGKHKGVLLKFASPYNLQPWSMQQTATTPTIVKLQPAAAETATVEQVVLHASAPRGYMPRRASNNHSADGDSYPRFMGKPGQVVGQQ